MKMTTVQIGWFRKLEGSTIVWIFPTLLYVETEDMKGVHLSWLQMDIIYIHWSTITQ